MLHEWRLYSRVHASTWPPLATLFGYQCWMECLLLITPSKWHHPHLGSKMPHPYFLPPTFSHSWHNSHASCKFQVVMGNIEYVLLADKHILVDVSPPPFWMIANTCSLCFFMTCVTNKPLWMFLSIQRIMSIDKWAHTVEVWPSCLVP